MNVTLLLSPFTLLLFTTGCRRDEIEIYRAPREMPTVPGSMSTMPAIPGMEASPEVKNRIRWKTPVGWQEQTPTTMRVGSFLIKDGSQGSADVSIVPLTGEAGGDLANVNRWRGQIQLAPWNAEGLKTNSRSERFKGHSMMWVDFANQGKRITAAIYKEGETSWFFKMMGDDVVVAKAHAEFKALLNSVDFHGHAH